MTNIEAMKKAHEARKAVKNCAKALYLIGDLKHVYYYLEAMTEANEITEADEDAIIDEISKECAGLTAGEIGKVKNEIEQLSGFRNWIDKALQRQVARTTYVGTKGGRKLYEVLFTDGGVKDYFIDFDDQTVEEVEDNRKTLGEQIGEIEKANPDRIVSVKDDKYGVVWTGKAKFVFGSFSHAAWNSTEYTII